MSSISVDKKYFFSKSKMNFRSIGRNWLSSVCIALIVLLGALTTVTLSANTPAQAAAPAEADTIRLLAAGERSAIFTTTAYNVTTNNNGTEWYYNEQSMGFAPGGATIDQADADVNDLSSPLRLSWHVGSTNLSSGYRAGADVGLGGEIPWTRAIYQASSLPAYYPSGPQTNVLKTDLTGWTLCFSNDYADASDQLADILAACTGDYLILAAFTDETNKINAQIEGNSVLNYPGGSQDGADNIFVGDTLDITLIDSDYTTPIAWNDYIYFVSECNVGECTPGSPDEFPEVWSEGTAFVDSLEIPAEAESKYVAIKAADDDTFVPVGENVITLEIENTPDVYSVRNCAELQALADDANSYNGVIRLEKNINCQGVDFEPIRWDANDFVGTFDGQGFSISNLAIDQPEDSSVGLFANSDGATIQNVNLLSGSVSGSDCVGSVVGDSNEITINNVVSRLNVSSEYSAGGLVGCIDGDSTIDRSMTSGTVSVDSEYAGGLVGYIDDDVEITKSFTTGDINGGDSIGGLIGYSDNDVYIYDSYASGDITGDYYCGGIYGEDYYGEAYSVYYSGIIDCQGDTGGLSGYDDDGYDWNDSFWDLRGGVNPEDTEGYLQGASGSRSTSDMKDIVTYTTDPDLDTPWDFETVWNMSSGANDGYPFLRWYTDVVVTDDDGVTSGVENAAPNGGDANNDGTPDSEQENVVSFVNSVSGKYVTLEVPDTCVIEDAGVESESEKSTQDSSFQYLSGLLDFRIDCFIPGISVTVQEYFFGAGSASNFTARKFTPYNNTYQTLDGAAVTNVSIGGSSAVKLVFSLTDGGQYDNDQNANGIIVDPAGLGSVAGTLPATGAELLNTLYISLTLLLTGMAMVFNRRKQTL